MVAGGGGRGERKRAVIEKLARKKEGGRNSKIFPKSALSDLMRKCTISIPS